MPDIPLGVYTTVGGNQCVASLHIEKAATVTVSFAWNSTPTADDREEWSFTILADGVSRAVQIMSDVRRSPVVRGDASRTGR